MTAPDDISHPRLEARLLAAHAAGDGAGLVRLYTEAADLSEAAGDIDRACFFLTHAYIFALDQGDRARAPALRDRLRAYGRED